MEMIKTILCILTLSISQFSKANTGELYGYGGRASALGNTMLGSSSDAFTTYYNPAANSANRDARFGLGLAYLHPEFSPINDIVISNTSVASEPGDINGNVNTKNYLDHFTQTIALGYSTGDDLNNFSLGFMGGMPIARLAYFDTGDPFLPEYYNYRSRTQRPQMYFSTGISLTDNLHIGAGVGFGTNVAIQANYTVSGSAGTVSHGRFATTAKPNASPYGSFLYDSKPFQTGLTFRAASKYKMNVNVNSDARVLGPANGFPIIFETSSVLFYDPMEVDYSFSYGNPDYTWITVEVDWLQYSAFESPTLTISDQGSGFQLKNSVSSVPEMRDIIVPKLGIEQGLSESIKLRMGYSYRRSPIKSNSGTGNIVDPSQHIITGGMGWDLHRANLSQRNIKLDFFGQYHHLISQHINKDSANEAGTATQSRVGSPGYNIGGKVYGGGMSVSFIF